MTIPSRSNLHPITQLVTLQERRSNFSIHEGLSSHIFEIIQKIELEDLPDDFISVELEGHSSKFKSDGESFTAALIFEKLLDKTTQSQSNCARHWKKILTPSNAKEISCSFIHLYKILARTEKLEFDEQEADKKIKEALVPLLISLMNKVKTVSVWRKIAEMIDVSSKGRLKDILPLILNDQKQNRYDDIPYVIAIMNNVMKANDYPPVDLHYLYDYVKQLVELTPQAERNDLCQIFLSIPYGAVKQLLTLSIPIFLNRNKANAGTFEDFRPITPIANSQLASSPSLLAAMFYRPTPQEHSGDQAELFRPIIPATQSQFGSAPLQSPGKIDRSASIERLQKDEWSPDIPTTLKLIMAVFNTKLLVTYDQQQDLDSEINSLLKMFDSCKSQEKRESFVSSFKQLSHSEKYAEFKLLCDLNHTRKPLADSSEVSEQFEFTD